MAPHQRIHRQKGVTMVSVMMLTVSLLTIGLLAVRSSAREVTQAGQLVARERATMVAAAAVDLAAARLMTLDNNGITQALHGYNPGGGQSCTNACQDCVPGGNTLMTGRRNESISNTNGCGGRPCMRPGSIVQLNDAAGTLSDWCEVPFRQILPGGDPEANVTVWLRNNTGEALGPNGTNSWLEDQDGRVVVTAMATVRGTTVTVEQEIQFTASPGITHVQPQSPDEGYGGGHNNDNASVSVCADEYHTVNG